jgi:molybdate transport system substrate-binding protein
MRSRAALLAVLLAVPLTPAALAAEDVLVYAAASLADALEEVGGRWRRTSGHTPVLNVGASSDLARQIRAGAPADVFFSADREHMDLLERAGLVRAADRVELLSNTLVVVVPVRSVLRLSGPADLVGLRRLALADPEAVPAGVYARRWLESAGLWPQVRDRVVPTLDVRAALAAVESENAEAAVVYRTDAARSRRARVAFEVPRGLGPPIVYVVAPLVRARPAAHELAAALASPSARAIFEKHGFLVRDGH